ncbi:YdcF family protein [Mycobacterium sp. CPCC 205372]|uniref:YdcF family protein n=1 Tax=Mycobacterium hippophais TaxID=3016340 RepID=A0ABT4PS19_9MYCO|nr:YdcF family protein [Mycobacterium hippophais]MCZ8379281.1 YdcF family protein [Mycobacterium hippophais]
MAALVGLYSVTGFAVFNRAAEDPLRQVDAIVVLGGEHDGREKYALSLAEGGLADTVVLSNPYPKDDATMSTACRDDRLRIEVICVRPDPPTTRGEAIFTHDLAVQRRWHHVTVVTWRFHIPRARLVFAQCGSPDGTQVTFRAVPRVYDYSPPRWAMTYAYQYAGFAKAYAQGDCDRSAGPDAKTPLP